MFDKLSSPGLSLIKYGFENVFILHCQKLYTHVQNLRKIISVVMAQKAVERIQVQVIDEVNLKLIKLFGFLKIA